MTPTRLAAIATLGLVLGAPPLAAGQTGTVCLETDARLYDGDINIIRLNPFGRELVRRLAPSAGLPVIRIDVIEDARAKEPGRGQRPAEGFRTRLSSRARALKTSIGRGVYEATLELAQFRWPEQKTEFVPVTACTTPLRIEILEARPATTRGSWNPTPQAWIAAGYLFADAGLEAPNLVSRFGVAASVTGMWPDDGRRAYASARLQVAATRGFWEFGVRSRLSSAGDHDWWRPSDPHPAIGFGLEVPPILRRPMWIVATLAVPSAPYADAGDWPLWRPGRWRFRADSYDLYVGVRWDFLRPVRR